MLKNKLLICVVLGCLALGAASMARANERPACQQLLQSEAFQLLGETVHLKPFMRQHLEALLAGDKVTMAPLPSGKSFARHSHGRNIEAAKAADLIRTIYLRQHRKLKALLSFKKSKQKPEETHPHAYLSAQDEFGNTLLHLVALLGRARPGRKAWRLVLKQKASTDIWFAPNKWGQTPLHFAVISNHKEGVQKLQQQLPQPLSEKDYPDAQGFTALHYAIMNHDIEFVKLFVKRCGAIGSTNARPLELAFQVQAFDIAEFLVKCYSSDFLMRLQKNTKWFPLSMQSLILFRQTKTKK